MAGDDDEFYDDESDHAPVPGALEDMPAAAADLKTTYDKERMDAIRASSEYQNARTAFRKDCAKMHVPMPDGSISDGAPCFNCGREIDYNLKHPHPESWSLEHIKTVKEAPHLILDLGNWASSHLDCNQRRGTDDEFALDIGVPSELW